MKLTGYTDLRIQPDRIRITIPNVAIIKIATTEKGVKDNLKEYELSKIGLIDQIAIKCESILLDGIIGVFEYIDPLYISNM